MSLCIWCRSACQESLFSLALHTACSSLTSSVGSSITTLEKPPSLCCAPSQYPVHLLHRQISSLSVIETAVSAKAGIVSVLLTFTQRPRNCLAHITGEQ